MHACLSWMQSAMCLQALTQAWQPMAAMAGMGREACMQLRAPGIVSAFLRPPIVFMMNNSSECGFAAVHAPAYDVLEGH